MENWRSKIAEKMRTVGDGWDNLVCSTLSSSELDAEFDTSTGRSAGKQLILWTESWVYLTVDFEDRDIVLRIPRNPAKGAGLYLG
jgi:hypothetical protein